MVRKHFQTQAQGKINSGRLIKSGSKYYVRYMDHADIPDSLDLQTHVLSVLKLLGKDHYIIEKSQDKLRCLLNTGNAIIGTYVKSKNPFKGDRLAAHMLVVYPTNEQETGIADTSALPEKDVSKISVVSNILVHQDFRGNKLMQQMLAEWLNIAKADKKSHAIAESCADNEFSWSVFLDCGFVIYGAAHDPRDNSDVFFLHKPLDHEFLYSSAPSDTTMVKLFDKNGEMKPQAYQQINNLLKQGYHALDYDRHRRYVLLAKCVGTAPLAANNNGPDNTPKP